VNKLSFGKHRHYKGKDYEVIALDKHRETLEDLVVYKSLYGNNQIWVRPLKMFLEKVEYQGKQVHRFKKISK